MNLKNLIASTAVALTLVSLPAMAGDHDKDKDGAHNKQHGQHSENDRYMFNIEPGEHMIFREPVSFTGKVTEATSYNRTIEASNGMTIKVPNQGLVWNGDRAKFAQTTEVGDEVVVHLRQEEQYRIMQTPSVDSPWLAVGSYEGVFYLSEDFIKDIDLDGLDNNIYSDKSEMKYDEDLETTK